MEEYFNSSENDQKRPENDIFRIFLLFVISRSGVRIRLPAPPTSTIIECGGIPEWPKGADCKSVVSVFGGSDPPSPTKHEKSELLPCGDWVRIFCLYQGYCILILYPLALCDYRTGGFFCLKVLLEVCCRIQYNYGKNDFISEVKRM